MVSYYRQAGSTREKYNRGYWLNFHLFLDMLEVADLKKDAALKEQVLRGYYSGNWSVVKAGE